MYSQEHVKHQKEIHARRPEYGAAGSIFAEMVLDIATSINTKDVLDFGAGKRSLSRSLPTLDIKSYDPAIDEIAGLPSPADLVVCTHVLPCIEPKYLQQTLRELSELTRKALLVVNTTEKSAKVLENGESATLIVKNEIAWINDLAKYFMLTTFNRMNDNEFMSVWVPKK